MANALSTKLTAACRAKTLVKFSRCFEAGSVNGYVLDVGPRWFLLLLLGDGIRFNGYQCFRLSDVNDLKVPHPYATFAAAALKKRRARFPKKPRVSTLNIERLLLCANRSFPLVTIHREKIDPDVCQIGRVLQIKGGRMLLLQINPGAIWDSEPTQYLLRDITRVDFGGEYEDALHLVGGYPVAR